MGRGEEAACPARAGLLVRAGRARPEARARPFPTGCLRGHRKANAPRAGSGSSKCPRNENDDPPHQPACRLVGDDARQHDPDCPVEQRRAKGMPTRKAGAVGDLDDLDQIGRRPRAGDDQFGQHIDAAGKRGDRDKGGGVSCAAHHQGDDDRRRDQRFARPGSPNDGEGDSQSVERRRWPGLDGARDLDIARQDTGSPRGDRQRQRQQSKHQGQQQPAASEGCRIDRFPAHTSLCLRHQPVAPRGRSELRLCSANHVQLQVHLTASAGQRQCAITRRRACCKTPGTR